MTNELEERIFQLRQKQMSCESCSIEEAMELLDLEKEQGARGPTCRPAPAQKWRTNETK